MGQVIIADIEETKSDETYYVMKSRRLEKHYIAPTLNEVQDNLIEKGFIARKITRSDGVEVDWWRKGEINIAVWDNELQPYRYL